MCSLITSSTQVFSILLVRYVLTDIRENGQSKTIIECAINSIPDCFLIHALQTLSFVIFASHLISRMKDQSVTEVLKKQTSGNRQSAESYQREKGLLDEHKGVTEILQLYLFHNKTVSPCCIPGVQVSIYRENPDHLSSHMYLRK